MEEIMSTDWMPGKRADQLAMAQEWIVLIDRNLARWNMQQYSLTTLESLAEEAQDCLAEAMSAHRTKVTTTKCTTAFAALVAFMRDTKDRYFKIPPMTEADFVSLGLRLKDTVPTPIGRPEGTLTALISYLGKGALGLHITPVSGHVYDPRSEWGFRVYYGVLPHGGATEDAHFARQHLMRVYSSLKEP